MGRMSRFPSLKDVATLKRIALAAALSFAPGAAQATDDVGAGLVGNTVELMGPGGTTSIYYPDGQTIVVRAPDGGETTGSWRVKNRQICTRVENGTENCTAPIDEPPVAGSAGTLSGSDGADDLEWKVKKGKAF